MDVSHWEKRVMWLHEYAGKLSDGELTILIHYWGASLKHTNNILHKHSFFEVCYIVDGQGRYYEKGQEFVLKPGTLLLSRPYRKHQIKSSGLKMLWIAFELNKEATSNGWNERFKQLEGAERFIIYNASTSPTTLVWLALMQSLADHAGQKKWMNRLGHSLTASFPSTFQPEHDDLSPVAPKRSNIQKNISKLIRDNLSSPLTLGDMAKFFHLSERQISRIFTQELSMSFTDYVRRERVNEAARLLRETDLSIKEISNCTGFGSVHYFTRVFKEIISLTPAGYRLARKAGEFGVK